MALLPRWITPSEFGLVGMASVFTALLGAVGDSGVMAAVIRRKTVDGCVEASAFWVSMAGATALSAVSLIGAPVLGWFFGEAKVPLLAGALAMGFLVAAPSRTPVAMLNRELRFGTLTTLAVSSSAAGLAVGILVAKFGGGAWSLVAQTLTAFAIQTAGALVIRPVAMSPAKVSAGVARELASFGSKMSGFNLANTASRVLDPMLGGRWIGPNGLGLVSFGMRAFVIPMGRICGALSSVFLPTIVSIDGEETRARAFTAAVRLTAIVTIPMSIGAAAIAPELEVLLPSKWAGIAWPLSIFAAGSVADSISWYCIAILTAYGRGGSLLRLGIGLVPISWVAVVAGTAGGRPAGLAAAWVTWNVAQTTGLVYLVVRTIPVGRQFAFGILRPFSIAVIMGIAVRATLAISSSGGSARGVVVGIGTGFVVYGALTLAFMRNDAQKILALCVSATGLRRPPHGNVPPSV